MAYTTEILLTTVMGLQSFSRSQLPAALRRCTLHGCPRQIRVATDSFAPAVESFWGEGHGGATMHTPPCLCMGGKDTPTASMSAWKSLESATSASGPGRSSLPEARLDVHLLHDEMA